MKEPVLRFAKSYAATPSMFSSRTAGSCAGKPALPASIYPPVRRLRPDLLHRGHSRTLTSSSPALATTPRAQASTAPRSHDRGPPSKEDTQTDFKKMDIFTNMPPPTSAVDVCRSDGFVLNSGVRITGGSGVLIVGGEAFGWKPWAGHAGGTEGPELNGKGQFEVSEAAWGLLGMVWPKPDLLVLGTGAKIAPVSPATRKTINNLGIRLEVQDTRNAAAQFNLLATERGVQQVAAALIPIGRARGT